MQLFLRDEREVSLCSKTELTDQLTSLELALQSNAPAAGASHPVTPKWRVQVQPNDINTPEFAKEITQSVCKRREMLRAQGQGASWGNQNLFWVIGRGPHGGICTQWEGGVQDIIFGPLFIKHKGFRTFLGAP
eukprot:1283039-Ditylum_brightwellii.AAC.1